MKDIRRLEHECDLAENEDRETIGLSIAYSLRRIADALSGTPLSLSLSGAGDGDTPSRIDWEHLMDLFDRIAAAITAKNSGDDGALAAHVQGIDAHLAQLDQSDTDEQSRLSNIEAGLGKIADAVAPPPAADTTAASGTGDGTGDAGAPAATGTQQQ